MTKQDKYGVKIGPIRLGVGFTASKHGSFAYPNDRLTSFLNINPAKYKEIVKFCNDYKFIPPKLYSSNIKDSFKEEQDKLLVIIKKSLHGKLDEGDFLIINSYLELLKPKVIPVTGKYVKGMNELLGGDYSNIGNNKEYWLKVFKSNSVSTLWEDFVNQSLKRQKLGECVNCGRFYNLESGHERNFCTVECGDAHRKREKRAEKMT